jgi:hypothetical protein
MLDLVIKNENTKCKRDKHKIFELLTKNGFWKKFIFLIKSFRELIIYEFMKSNWW